MNSIRRHVPRYADVDRPITPIPFKTIQELFDIDFVKFFSAKPEFSHFVMSDEHLMAILNSGYQWIVVGSIEDPAAVDIPAWEGVKYNAELPSGERKTLTRDDVSSSCGDELRLYDGTTAKNLRY